MRWPPEEILARYLLEIEGDDAEDWRIPPDFVWPELSDEIRATAALIDRIYDLPGGSVGGPLHIIVEDDNVDDYHLDSCQEQVDSEPDSPPESVLARVCQDVLDAMRPMTNTQRLMALAVHNGYIDRAAYSE